jgi:hypothetical protein
MQIAYFVLVFHSKRLGSLKRLGWATSSLETAKIAVNTYSIGLTSFR